MITFIDDNRASHGVEPICNVLPIAPSTYHKHVAQRRDPLRLSARAQRDIALKPEVARVFAENFAVYGVRKVWRQMVRDMGLAGVIRGKPVRTTISDQAAPCPLDHVNRQFHAPAPNRLWVSDFTDVSTWGGPRLWAVPQALPPPAFYVAFVIDVFARYIVGWRVSRTAHASFLLETPTHSLWVPASDLFAHNTARWDGARSWMDASGDIIAAQIGRGDSVALVFDKARLLAYLTATKSRIVWVVFENRHASVASEVVNSNDLHQAWSWSGKSLTKLAEKQDRYADEDEDMDIAANDDAQDVTATEKTPD